MKTLSKLVLACLTIELALSIQLVERKPAPPPPTPDCRDRLVCQSNNDPHMVNFWNQHFEFQNSLGEHCMHKTDYVYVSASFYQCPPPHLTATCNCDVKITLNNGETASISNCGSSSFQIDTLALSSSPSVGCDIVTNNQFDPLDESDWALLPVNSGNAHFLCARVNGNTYIKTNLPNWNHNVIVEVTPGMSSLRVYSSRKYRANPTINDKCLCEGRQGRNIQEHNEFWAIALKNRERERCNEKLLSKCFIEIVRPLLSEESLKEIDNLALNCAIDLQLAEGKEEQVGAFQKNDIQNKIYEAILKALGDDALTVISKLCECETKRPNFDCIQFGKCEGDFALCID